MDSWEGAAELEWWANRITCLDGIGVRVTVCVSGDDWTCDAVFDPPLSRDAQEGFDFLMELDPLFTLRFDEEGTMPTEIRSFDGGSTILVDVSVTEDQGRLSLAAFEAEAA
ncbi:hypothetical protein ACEZCY_04680 [Streptacidiphilus sp. N1-12]|uniref:Uncharacterized protein n=2 Tax=Streptacidiphilus alkalitolerans TaxID=3342712 RepID=A0ABV6V4E1_9ACTN